MAGDDSLSGELGDVQLLMGFPEAGLLVARDTGMEKTVRVSSVSLMNELSPVLGYNMVWRNHPVLSLMRMHLNKKRESHLIFTCSSIQRSSSDFSYKHDLLIGSTEN